MIEALALDLDGTLIDSRRDIASAVNRTLTNLGRRPLSVERICSYIGDGARELVARSFELEPSDPELTAALGEFIRYYTERPVVETRPYPGVAETLRQFTLPLALCTNKPRGITLKVLDQLGLLRHFEILVCGDDFPERKPHPRPLLEVAEKLECLTEELLMVGDSVQDIECGKRAGASTVAVSYGIMSVERLRAEGADYEIGNFAELSPLLARLRAGSG